MVMNTTKNSALDTALSFYYQTLVTLNNCFDLKKGGQIKMEKDGDISIIGNLLTATQIEVKHYSDALTDNHENFWKTLSNWVQPEFKYEAYQYLVLYTTQSYGARTLLKTWNEKDENGKLEILKTITQKTRKQTTRKTKNGTIEEYRDNVMNTPEEKLKNILSKVYLSVENKDVFSLRESLLEKISYISDEYKNQYIDGLTGFLYRKAQKGEWIISYQEFNEKRLELTRIYSSELPFPEFFGEPASTEDADRYQSKLFVSKIKNIEYDDVLPEAIGNYLELIHTLNRDLDISSTYRAYTNNYRNMLASKLNRQYAKAKREQTHPQTFYDDAVGENPFSLKNYCPDMAYKNGLIHDIMDDDEQNLKWDTTQ